MTIPPPEHGRIRREKKVPSLRRMLPAIWAFIALAVTIFALFHFGSPNLSDAILDSPAWNGGARHDDAQSHPERIPPEGEDEEGRGVRSRAETDEDPPDEAEEQAHTAPSPPPDSDDEGEENSREISWIDTLMGLSPTLVLVLLIPVLLSFAVKGTAVFTTPEGLGFTIRTMLRAGLVAGILMVIYLAFIVFTGWRIGPRDPAVHWWLFQNMFCGIPLAFLFSTVCLESIRERLAVKGSRPHEASFGTGMITAYAGMAIAFFGVEAILMLGTYPIV